MPLVCVELDTSSHPFWQGTAVFNLGLVSSETNGAKHIDRESYRFLIIIYHYNLIHMTTNHCSWSAKSKLSVNGIELFNNQKMSSMN